MVGLVKIDCPRLAVPFTYTGNSLYHRRGTTVDRGGYAVGPQWTGERDCRGLRNNLRGGERVGEKNLDCTVQRLTKRHTSMRSLKFIVTQMKCLISLL